MVLIISKTRAPNHRKESFHFKALLFSSLHNSGGVAQMVERSLSMREVPGSIPGASNKYFLISLLNSFQTLFVSPTSSSATTPGAFWKRGDAILKMTAETDQTSGSAELTHRGHHASKPFHFGSRNFFGISFNLEFKKGKINGNV